MSLLMYIIINVSCQPFPQSYHMLSSSIFISGTIAYSLILSQTFCLPMCQPVCLRRHKCGRDWQAFHQIHFLFFLDLYLHHIVQASLQSGLAICLSCSQLNVNGSECVILA